MEQNMSKPSPEKPSVLLHDIGKSTYASNSNFMPIVDRLRTFDSPESEFVVNVARARIIFEGLVDISGSACGASEIGIPPHHQD